MIFDLRLSFDLRSHSMMIKMKKHEVKVLLVCGTRSSATRHRAAHTLDRLPFACQLTRLYLVRAHLYFYWISADLARATVLDKVTYINFPPFPTLQRPRHITSALAPLTLTQGCSSPFQGRQKLHRIALSISDRPSTPEE